MYKSLEDVLRVTANNKPQKVIDLFTESYLQGLEFKAWLAEQKLSHSESFPETIDGDEILDSDDEIIGHEQIPNPDFIKFDVWLVETEQVETGAKNILDEMGEVTGTEPVYAEKRLREYVEVTVDIAEFQSSNKEFLLAEVDNRREKIHKLTVTTSAGNTFNANSEAMLNMLAAIQAAETLSISESKWRLADNTLVTITLNELKEAQALSVQAMGEVVLMSRNA